MILMKLYRMGLVMLGVIVLAGCQTVAPGDGTVRVVVGLYPYAYLAEQIGGDRVQVTNLTMPGAEPHDLELTAGQVAQVARADLMIYQPGLQPAVDQAVGETTPNALDVTRVASLDGHDPHIWLDLTKLIAIAGAIAEQLTQIDPNHRADYAEGLRRLSQELTDLDQQWTSGLANCQRTSFVTTHEAFGYLAKRYGLTQIAIAGLSPDAEPSPSRIAEIHKLVAETGITTIFFETLASPALAQTIAKDLGLATDVLDPLEGLTAQSRGSDYREVMEANLHALRLANGCS
jgi:zinc transport system substrate-binding protein